MAPNRSAPALTVALDARLIGTTSTGDATYWRGLVSGLAQIDENLRFLLISNGPQPEIVPNSPRFQWVEIPTRNARWWSLVQFPLAARRLRAQVVHTQYNLSPMVTRGGVTTVHDVSFRIEPSWFKPSDRFLLNRFVGSSMRRATRVITVSQTSAQDILRAFPQAAGKLRVTPLSCGLGITPIPREDAIQLVQRELGVEPPFLLTVGTRWPRKNFQLALDAVGRLPESDPRTLVVTGKPGWGETQAGPKVRATGYVTDRQLSALYCCADLYLVPSRYEGFGLTLLEAFSCGCPTLCSTGGSLPEVAGDAASVLASWDPADWASEILRLLGDSSTLAGMRERGLQRARQFSWSETAQRTVDVYREVAE